MEKREAKKEIAAMTNRQLEKALERVGYSGMAVNVGNRKGLEEWLIEKIDKSPDDAVRRFMEKMTGW